MRDRAGIAPMPGPAWPVARARRLLQWTGSGLHSRRGGSELRDGAEVPSSSGRLWAVSLVLVAAVVPYAGTIRYGFAFDDASEIVRNEDIRSVANVPRLFTRGAWDGAGERNPIYRPLTSATYAVNHALGGLRPAGFHIVN